MARRERRVLVHKPQVKTRVLKRTRCPMCQGAMVATYTYPEGDDPTKVVSCPRCRDKQFTLTVNK